MKEPLWQFCESSQPLLQRCIEAANRNSNINNKWLEHFGTKTITNIDNVEKMIVDEETEMNTPEPSVNHEKLSNTMSREKNLREVSKDIFTQELADLDPINNFDDIMEKCLQNTETYTFLAKNLPFTAIEKLCNHIFNLDNIDLIFLEHFYKLFLLELFKRDNTHLCLDLLIKAKKYIKIFDEFLYIFVNDPEIPKHLLLEYVSTLNSTEKSELLKNICQTISQDVFLHHMHTIHTMYKESENSEEVQKCIFKNLKKISPFCLNDKNFGKFLLNFLQMQKNYPINCLVLDKIVESHSSVFKKPCVNALNEIKRLQNLSQM
ncbi:unnamed protein product, partial [Brenthis ino]